MVWSEGVVLRPSGEGQPWLDAIILQLCCRGPPYSTASAPEKGVTARMLPVFNFLDTLENGIPRGAAAKSDEARERCPETPAFRAGAHSKSKLLSPLWLCLPADPP